MYNSRYNQICQDHTPMSEPLSDIGRNGRERPWRAYKVANEYLALAYDDINESKADRLRACARFLTFAENKEGKRRLVGADSCRVRLCPLCSWRRSLKNFWNTTAIVNWLSEHQNDQNVGCYDYIFVTLTVKNCQADDLSATIDQLYSGVKRLSERQEIRSAWKGMVRNMEVTHNVNPDSPDYDTFHPHFHMIVAVRPSYFHHDYVTQKRLTELWRDALRVDYDPIVDIRRIKPKHGEQTQAGAIAECSKYAAKATDYIIPQDWDLTVGTVRILDQALANRRLINYTGVFRDIKALLQLEDCEDGDLVKVGEEEEPLGGDVKLVTFMWYAGYRQYYRVT